MCFVKMNGSNNINNSTNHIVTIDPVTALQEGIDGLSLAMFEALRGLRDASTFDDDSGDDVNAITSLNSTMQQNALHQQQDQELVQKLVDTVFEKSNAINNMLDNNNDDAIDEIDQSNVKRRHRGKLFSNRTKEQQMKYIDELIHANNNVIQELYDVVHETMQQRDRCRQFIISQSSSILLPDENLSNNDRNDTNNDTLTTTAATTTNDSIKMEVD